MIVLLEITVLLIIKQGIKTGTVLDTSFYCNCECRVEHSPSFTSIAATSGRESVLSTRYKVSTVLYLHYNVDYVILQ